MVERQSKRIAVYQALYFILLSLMCLIPLGWYRRDVSEFGAMAEGFHHFWFTISVSFGFVGVLIMVLSIIYIQGKERRLSAIIIFAALNALYLSAVFYLTHHAFHEAVFIRHFLVFAQSIFLSLLNILTLQRFLLQVISKKWLIALINILCIVGSFLLFIRFSPMINYFPHTQVWVAFYQPVQESSDLYKLMQSNDVFIIVNVLFAFLWIILHKCLKNR